MKKEKRAVFLLDLFAKTFCIKNDENKLMFECDQCPFRDKEGYCTVKIFKKMHDPEYENFGAMIF